MNIFSRDYWLSIRDNGGNLSRFFRSRGTFVPLPKVKQGEGRNGAKAAARAAKKTRALP